MHLVNMNDHEFSRYLRQQGAIDNYDVLPNHNVWRNAKGNMVALVVYDNALCFRWIYIP